MRKNLKLTGDFSKDLESLKKEYGFDDKDGFTEFSKRLVKTNTYTDSISLRDLYEEYCNFCGKKGFRPSGKNFFSAQANEFLDSRCALAGNITGFRYVILKK